MSAGSSRPLQTNKEWKALPPLRPYYGKAWYIKREGEGAFDPVINRTPAQAAAVRLMPKPPNLETYAAALSRDEMDKTVVMEYGTFMPTDIDRAHWIEAMIKDHKLAKHIANALLMYLSLESHCPRCTEIHDPRHRNFSKEACIVLSVRELQDMGGFLPCSYIYRVLQPMHARKYCPRINLCCFNCLCRGHAEVDNVCKDKDVNLALFEDTARVEWVTSNQFRQEGCALGFFPILTLPQVCHVENMGGYLRLLAMSIPEAQKLVTEGIELHQKWVGAEPYFTQAAARKGFLMATYDAEYAAYVGSIMQEGGRHRQRTVRAAVNLQARFFTAVDDGVPWGEQTD
jgi:hypothetical protein